MEGIWTDRFALITVITFITWSIKTFTRKSAGFYIEQSKKS
jgi:hypothetical protein